MHEPHGAFTAADGDFIAVRKFADDLSVGIEKRGRLGLDGFDAERGGQRQNDGTIRERVRADRREHKDIRRRQNDRAARRQRVSGGTGRRTDDQTVAAVTRDVFAIHAHIERDEPRSRATADDDVIQRAGFDIFAGTNAGGSDEGAGLEMKFTLPDELERICQSVRRNGGKETEPADVHAEHGRVGAGDLPRGVEHCAVAAEDDEQIYFVRQRGGGGADGAFQLGELRGDRVAHDRAAGALDETGGGADAGGAGGFFRVAEKADALEMVSELFQSAPKILCSRPGRAGEIQPHRASKGQSAR